MQLQRILEILEKFCPNKLAEVDDVVGLQTPNREVKINKILITLDCSQRAIAVAIKNKCNLIISHHPLLWPSVEESTKKPSIQERLNTLKSNEISLYSLHTNYDTKFLRYEMLKQTSVKMIKASAKEMIIFGNLEKSLPFKTVLKKIKNWYSVASCQYWTDQKDKVVKKIAFIPGAGGFILEQLVQEKVDLFITGELKWSQWIQCRDTGQSVVTIGHQTEQSFIVNLKKVIAQKVPQMTVIEHWEEPINTF